MYDMCAIAMKMTQMATGNCERAGEATDAAGARRRLTADCDAPPRRVVVDIVLVLVLVLVVSVAAARGVGVGAIVVVAVIRVVPFVAILIGARNDDTLTLSTKDELRSCSRTVRG